MHTTVLFGLLVVVLSEFHADCVPLSLHVESVRDSAWQTMTGMLQPLEGSLFAFYETTSRTPDDDEGLRTLFLWNRPGQPKAIYNTTGEPPWWEDPESKLLGTTEFVGRQFFALVGRKYEEDLGQYFHYLRIELRVLRNDDATIDTLGAVNYSSPDTTEPKYREDGTEDGVLEVQNTVWTYALADSTFPLNTPRGLFLLLMADQSRKVMKYVVDPNTGHLVQVWHKLVVPYATDIVFRPLYFINGALFLQEVEDTTTLWMTLSLDPEEIGGFEKLHGVQIGASDRNVQVLVALDAETGAFYSVSVVPAPSPVLCARWELNGLVFNKRRPDQLGQMGQCLRDLSSRKEEGLVAIHTIHPKTREVVDSVLHTVNLDFERGRSTSVSSMEFLQDGTSLVLAGNTGWHQVSTGSVVEFADAVVALLDGRTGVILDDYRWGTPRQDWTFGLVPLGERNGAREYLLTAALDGPITHTAEPNPWLARIHSAIYCLRISPIQDDTNGPSLLAYLVASVAGTVLLGCGVVWIAHRQRRANGYDFSSLTHGLLPLVLLQ